MARKKNPMFTSILPRYPLAHLPTPLEKLPRLSEKLNIDLWIKRDDQTGLAGGGNKTRKLEYLIADALTSNADTVITGGAPQSNHCRQTAAAAVKAGLHCVLVLGGEPAAINGNILLDTLMNAELVWTGDTPRDEMMQQTFEQQKTLGRKPYLIPYGGSNIFGATAYAQAVEELTAQLIQNRMPAFDRIIFASSSGGTHAGIALGVAALNLPTQVLGISIDKPEVELSNDIVATLANKTAARLNLDLRFDGGNVFANANYLGKGYGIMGDAERDAITLFAREEAILLDPVYTGRAAAGLIDLVQRGDIMSNERILFWHTGGLPALFAPQYIAELIA